MEDINFVAIDIETANFDNDAPIKIGITIVKGGEIINSFCKWINPEAEFDWYMVNVLHFNPADFIDKPTFPNVWKEIEPILSAAKFIVAHGASLDYKVLKNTLERYHLPFPKLDKLLCSMVIARKVFTASPSFGLPWLSKQFDFDWFGWEAANNAKVCALILLRELQEAQMTDLEALCSEKNVIIGSLSADGTYIKCLSKRSWKSRPSTTIKCKDIIPDESKFDEDHLLFGHTVVFTGKLSRLTRNEARQKVADIGAIPQDSVTKETEFLVVGQQDYRVVGEDGMSIKQERAIKYKSQGIDIEIMSENEFMDLF